MLPSLNCNIFNLYSLPCLWSLNWNSGVYLFQGIMNYSAKKVSIAASGFSVKLTHVSNIIYWAIEYCQTSFYLPLNRVLRIQRLIVKLWGWHIISTEIFTQHCKRYCNWTLNLVKYFRSKYSLVESYNVSLWIFPVCICQMTIDK